MRWLLALYVVGVPVSLYAQRRGGQFGYRARPLEAGVLGLLNAVLWPVMIVLYAAALAVERLGWWLMDRP